jgi:signal peptidase I
MEKKTNIFKGKLLLPIIIILIVGFNFLGPFRLCAVPTGSMEPNIPTWSLCLVNVKTPYEDIETGDIVVYERKSDGLRIIHRVIAITDAGMVTKGDANSIDDGVSVTPDNLFGKYLGHIPQLGRLPMLIRTPAGIAVIAVLAIGLLVWSVADDAKALKRKRDDQDPPEDEGS